MGLFDGDTWVVPETFSFICRICEIMAMSCILMPEKMEGQVRTVSELLFIFSCAIVFFLNCFEFIGTAKENLMVQLTAISIAIFGTGLLLINADPLQHQIYSSAFHASIFRGVSILSCAVSGADFYIHMRFLHL